MQGTRNMAQRSVEAENAFIEIVRDAIDCSEDDARKVLTVFIKERVAKLDIVGGRYKVTHGAFMEPQVFRNALNLS